MSNQIAIGVAYKDQAIEGGTIDNSPIGATTPSTGMFSSLGVSVSTVAAAAMPHTPPLLV